MVKVKRCSFCGFDIPIGRGLLFVKKDGTILTFCTNKCKRLMLKHNKNPRKTRWTSYYGKE